MRRGAFANLLVPSLCPLCRGVTDPEALICGRCTRELNLRQVLRGDPPAGVDGIVSCAGHEGTARDLLVAYKFRRLVGLAPLIAGFMADLVAPGGDQRILVPVPPARLRTWGRGFDPVAVLAGEIESSTELQATARPLLERRGSGRQRGRGRVGRMADPPDIRARKEAGALLGGCEVLLVDDVMTTGATLSAAAHALRKAGAEPVYALTFTRRL